jgi:hypothetical protein
MDAEHGGPTTQPARLLIELDGLLIALGQQTGGEHGVPNALKVALAADNRLGLGRIKLSVNLGAKHLKFSLQGGRRDASVQSP